MHTKREKDEIKDFKREIVINNHNNNDNGKK